MPMKLQRFVPHLVSVMAATAPVAAQPIPAATPEGIFCTGTYIAVGRVLDAASADCRIGRTEGCSPDNVVDLKVEITEVIGAREPSPSYSVGRSLNRGDIIPISSRAFTSLVVTAIPQPPSIVLSNQQIRDAFVNKEFIFSVTMMDYHVQHHSTFWASLWPMSEKVWALDTMTNERGANCPRRL